MKGDVSREVGSIDDGDDEIIFAKRASQNTDISLFCAVMILYCVHFSMGGGTPKVSGRQKLVGEKGFPHLPGQAWLL